MTAPSPLDSAVVERKASGPSVVVMVALGVLGQVCCTVPVAVAVAEVSLPTSLRYSFCFLYYGYFFCINV